MFPGDRGAALYRWLHLEALLKLFWAANSREPADVKERHEWASPADYLRPVNPLQILTISDIEQELARVDAHAPMLQLGSTPASVEQIDALIGRANGSRTITVTYRNAPLVTLSRELR